MRLWLRRAGPRSGRACPGWKLAGDLGGKARQLCCGEGGADGWAMLVSGGARGGRALRAGATRGLWRVGRARSAEASGREWAERGAGAERAEGDRPRAWVARVETGPRERRELGRKGKDKRFAGWVGVGFGLLWVWV